MSETVKIKLKVEINGETYIKSSLVTKRLLSAQNSKFKLPNGDLNGRATIDYGTGKTSLVFRNKQEFRHHVLECLEDDLLEHIAGGIWTDD